MSGRKPILLIALGIVLLSAGFLIRYLFVLKSSETGHHWDGSIIDQMEAQAKIDYFTKDIQFDYDSSVLPSSSYAALDSVIAVIRQYDSSRFQYVFEVHTQQDDRTDAEELHFSQQIAEELRKYLLHAGIPASVIETVGMGIKSRGCYEEKGDVDCFHRNNRLEIKVNE